MAQTAKSNKNYFIEAVWRSLCSENIAWGCFWWVSFQKIDETNLFDEYFQKKSERFKIWPVDEYETF